MGKIVVELYWDHAPKTCKNFAELARRGYYDKSIFHRVVKDFIVQGGDPTGTGRGGSSIYGKYFDDEINSDLKHSGSFYFDFYLKKNIRSSSSRCWNYFNGQCRSQYQWITILFYISTSTIFR